MICRVGCAQIGLHRRGAYTAREKPLGSRCFRMEAIAVPGAEIMGGDSPTPNAVSAILVRGSAVFDPTGNFHVRGDLHPER